MCTVKPYRILNEGFRTFCRKASLPFPGKWTWGCGITFDIFTHDLHGSFKIYYNIFIHKKIQVAILVRDIMRTCLKERNIYIEVKCCIIERYTKYI